MQQDEHVKLYFWQETKKTKLDSICLSSCFLCLSIGLFLLLLSHGFVFLSAILLTTDRTVQIDWWKGQGGEQKLSHTTTLAQMHLQKRRAQEKRTG